MTEDEKITAIKKEQQEQRDNIISVYFKLINYSLKGDLVGGIFIFGWICTLFAVEILSFQFGILTASFYSILPSRNSGKLVEIIVRFCTFLMMMAIGKGSLMATRGLLGRAMRRNLTQFLHSNYITLRGLKALHRDSENLDCPDQRITEDVDKFTLGLLEISEIIFLTPVLTTFYTIQVSSKLGFGSILAIYSHFLLSIFILKFGLKKLRELTAEKEKREANFRNEHVSLRNMNESLIFINSESLLGNLQKNLNFQLKKLLFTSKTLLITESVYELTKSFFSYSGALLNFLLMAGEMSWGLWKDEKDSTRIAELISMTSFLSLYLIFQLSKLASVTDLIGSLNGQITRLSQLLRAIETSHDQVLESVLVRELIEFKNFTGIVNEMLLYENFSLKIDLGENVLITGKNGSGKTSILRFITGLWPISGGNIKIYSKRFTCCPQNFVIFSGSLYDLLGINFFNCEESSVDEESKIIESFDDEIKDILDVVGLDTKLFEPFNKFRSISTWQSILTPGQHQRIALARAFLSQPHLVVLDETFLAMSQKETERILKEFEKRKVSILVLDPTGDIRTDDISNSNSINNSNNYFFKHIIKL